MVMPHLFNFFRHVSFISNFFITQSLMTDVSSLAVKGQSPQFLEIPQKEETCVWSQEMQRTKNHFLRRLGYHPARSFLAWFHHQAVPSTTRTATACVVATLVFALSISSGTTNRFSHRIIPFFCLTSRKMVRFSWLLVSLVVFFDGVICTPGPGPSIRSAGQFTGKTTGNYND